MLNTIKKNSVKKIFFSLLVGFVLIFTLSACSSTPVSTKEYQDNDWVAKGVGSEGLAVDVNFTENEVIMDIMIAKIVFDYEIDKDEIILTNQDNGESEIYKVEKEDDSKVKWTLFEDDDETVREEITLIKLN